MSAHKASIGVIGLGTMGSNLLKNMADSGFSVAGYDKDLEKVKALDEETKEYDILPCFSPEQFMGVLESPRAILLSVPAGKVVDYVIADLLPHLDKGDIIIDGGNSHFPDSERRFLELKEKEIEFLGLGISGGSKGARKGPSMMPGGEKTAYQRVQPVLEAISAKVGSDPCVAYLGKGSAGHYVKMVHNGIEYGLMQILAEAYDFMKVGMLLSNQKIHEIFKSWNEGDLQSYLVEITADIFNQKDSESDGDLIDQILDVSRSKGTGKWTSQDAMNVQAPVHVIDLAVASRDISKYKEQRVVASKLYASEQYDMEIEDNTLEVLRNAVHAAFYISYAQGLAQLKLASDEYGYDLSLYDVTKIWRGGCIIRAKMLNEFMQAFESNRSLENILLDASIANRLKGNLEELRSVVAISIIHEIPVPCLSAAMSYFDSYKRESLPANLIQAQRDYFGAHSFERKGRAGKFHADWGHN